MTCSPRADVGGRRHRWPALIPSAAIRFVMVKTGAKPMVPLLVSLASGVSMPQYPTGRKRTFSLCTFSLRQASGRSVILAVHAGADVVRAAPFADIDPELAWLWPD
jgi:hypothetical protein